jgi:GNAT superfamily N-acetyltransferase
LAAFAGLLWIPVSNGPDRGKVVHQVSRLVTLPDWQGMGLAMALVDKLGAEHKAEGKRLRTYPAHPSLIGAFDRSRCWTIIKKPGFRNAASATSTTSGLSKSVGGRPCATFEYCGEAASKASGLISGNKA